MRMAVVDPAEVAAVDPAVVDPAVDPAEVAVVDPAEVAVVDPAVDPAEVANRQRGFPAKLRRRELCLRWTFRISPMGMATPPIWCS